MKMKKLLLSLGIMLSCSGAFAQSGKIELGAKLNYGFSEPTWSMGLVGRYNIDNHFRVEGAVNYYPKNENKLEEWDANANLHYIFHVTERFKLYPIGGLCIASFNQDVKDGSLGDTKVGMNIGAGLQFNIMSDLHLNAETYYNCINKYDRAITNVSLVYVF